MEAVSGQLPINPVPPSKRCVRFRRSHQKRHKTAVRSNDYITILRILSHTLIRQNPNFWNYKSDQCRARWMRDREKDRRMWYRHTDVAWNNNGISSDHSSNRVESEIQPDDSEIRVRSSRSIRPETETPSCDCHSAHSVPIRQYLKSDVIFAAGLSVAFAAIAVMGFILVSSLQGVHASDYIQPKFRSSVNNIGGSCRDHSCSTSSATRNENSVLSTQFSDVFCYSDEQVPFTYGSDGKFYNPELNVTYVPQSVGTFSYRISDSDYSSVNMHPDGNVYPGGPYGFVAVGANGHTCNPISEEIAANLASKISSPDKLFFPSTFNTEFISIKHNIPTQSSWTDPLTHVKWTVKSDSFATYDFDNMVDQLPNSRVYFKPERISVIKISYDVVKKSGTPRNVGGVSWFEFPNIFKQVGKLINNQANYYDYFFNNTGVPIDQYSWGWNYKCHNRDDLIISNTFRIVVPNTWPRLFPYYVPTQKSQVQGDYFYIAPASLTKIYWWTDKKPTYYPIVAVAYHSGSDMCHGLLVYVIENLQSSLGQLDHCKVNDVTDSTFYTTNRGDTNEIFTYCSRVGKTAFDDATLDDYHIIPCNPGTGNMQCDVSLETSDCKTVTELAVPICGSRASEPYGKDYFKASLGSVLTIPNDMTSVPYFSITRDYFGRNVTQFDGAFQFCVAVSSSSEIGNCKNFSTSNPTGSSMLDISWPTTQPIATPVKFTEHSRLTPIFATSLIAPLEVTVNYGPSWKTDCINFGQAFESIPTGTDVCRNFSLPAKLKWRFTSRNNYPGQHVMIITKSKTVNVNDINTLSFNGPFTPISTPMTLSSANAMGEVYLKGYEPRDLIGDPSRIADGKLSRKYSRIIVDHYFDASVNYLTDLPCDSDDRPAVEQWLYTRFQQEKGAPCYYAKPTALTTDFDSNYTLINKITTQYINPYLTAMYFLKISFCDAHYMLGLAKSPDSFVIIKDTIVFPAYIEECDHDVNLISSITWYGLSTNYDDESEPRWVSSSTVPNMKWNTLYTLPLSYGETQAVFVKEVGFDQQNLVPTGLFQTEIGIYQKNSLVTLQKVELTKDGYKPTVVRGIPQLSFTSTLTENKYYSRGVFSDYASIFTSHTIDENNVNSLLYYPISAYNKFVSLVSRASAPSKITTGVLNVNPFDRPLSKFNSEVRLSQQPDRCHWAYQDYGHPTTPWGSVAHETCRSNQASEAGWIVPVIIALVILAWPLFIWLLQFITVVWNILNVIFCRKKVILNELDVVSCCTKSLWCHRVDGTSLSDVLDQLGFKYSISNNICLHPEARGFGKWFTWKMRMYTWRHFYPIFLVLYCLLFWWRTKKWEIFIISEQFLLNCLTMAHSDRIITEDQYSELAKHVQDCYSKRRQKKAYVRWGFWSGLSGYASWIIQRPMVVNDDTLKQDIVVRRNNHNYSALGQTPRPKRTEEYERDIYDEVVPSSGLRRRTGATLPLITLIQLMFMLIITPSAQAVSYNDLNFRKYGIRTSPGPPNSGEVYEYTQVQLNGVYQDAIHIKAQIPLTVGNFYQYTYRIPDTEITGSGVVNVSEVIHTITLEYRYTAYNHVYKFRTCLYDCGSGAWIFSCGDPSGYYTKGGAASGTCDYVDGSNTYDKRGLLYCCTENGTKAFLKTCPVDNNDSVNFDINYYGFPVEHQFKSGMGSCGCWGWGDDCGWNYGFQLVAPDLKKQHLEVFRIVGVTTSLTITIVDEYLGISGEYHLEPDSSTTIEGDKEIIQFSNLNIGSLNNIDSNYIMILNNPSNFEDSGIVQVFYSDKRDIPVWGEANNQHIIKFMSTATLKSIARSEVDQSHFPTQQPSVCGATCNFVELSSDLDLDRLESYYYKVKEGIGVQDIRVSRTYTDINSVRMNPTAHLEASNTLSGSVNIDAYLTYVLDAQVKEVRCDVSRYTCSVTGKANTKNGVTIYFKGPSDGQCQMEIDKTSEAVPSVLLFTIDSGESTQFGYAGSPRDNYTMYDADGHYTRCEGNVGINDGYFDTSTSSDAQAHSDNDNNASIGFWDWLNSLAVGWQIFMWIVFVILGLIILTIVYKILSTLFSFDHVIPVKNVSRTIKSYGKRIYKYGQSKLS